MNAIKEDDFKLKLSSKKLHSGRHQVKFEVKNSKKRKLYGYLLAEPNSTLTEVVEKILKRINALNERDEYYHGHLYSMVAVEKHDDDIMIFEK